MDHLVNGLILAPPLRQVRRVLLHLRLIYLTCGPWHAFPSASCVVVAVLSQCGQRVHVASAGRHDHVMSHSIACASTLAQLRQCAHAHF